MVSTIYANENNITLQKLKMVSEIKFSFFKRFIKVVIFENNFPELFLFDNVHNVYHFSTWHLSENMVTRTLIKKYSIRHTIWII